MVIPSTTPSEKDGDTGITLRAPDLEDGHAVHRLVGECPPLDLNSTYLYLLVCSHFARTSVVAEDRNGRLLGFVSGYRKPDAPDTLFVWQVAVHQDARGQKLAGRMIEDILARDICHDVSRIEATVSPSNVASLALFRSLAKRKNAKITSSVFITERHYGDAEHEAEDLIRIGPFTHKPTLKKGIS